MVAVTCHLSRKLNGSLEAHQLRIQKSTHLPMHPRENQSDFFLFLFSLPELGTCFSEASTLII